jgi:hypothetical protein
MIEKPVLLDETWVRWKVVRPVFVASIVALIGISGFRMLVIAMVGTIPDLPIATQSAAPVPFGQEAKDPASNPASIERAGRGGITDPTAPTQVAKATSTGPGEWLIDDVAKARARPLVAPASANLLPATAATADAQVEARVGSRSPDNTRAGADERRPGWPAGAFARADASRALDDAGVSCIEEPVGQAPEGKRWYYRLDQDHRKCWYVRTRKHETSRRSGRHLRSAGTWAEWKLWGGDW